VPSVRVCEVCVGTLRVRAAVSYCVKPFRGEEGNKGGAVVENKSEGAKREGVCVLVDRQVYGECI